MRRWVARAAAAVGLALAAAACEAGPAGDGGAAFEPDPDCFGVAPAGLDSSEVRCGHVTVPLDHADPAGRTIRLAVAVLPATDPAAGDDPVVVLEGGPGGHLVEPALMLPPHREQLRIGPPTVLLDQRGVGLSEPALECPGYVDAVGGAATHPEAIADGVDALADCRDRLADQGIDPQHFNSEAIAADVDAVRAALGAERVHLRGGSYGAEVALRAADAAPDRVASLILSSPVDPTVNWIAQAPATLDRALDEVAAACEAQPECAERFGDVRELLRAAVDPLADAPRDVRVRRTDGRSDTLRYTAPAAAGHLRWLLYLPPAMGPERLPALAAEAAAGDHTPLATLGSRLEQRVLGVVSHGLHHAVRCTGHAAPLSADDVRAATAAADPALVAEHLLPAEAALLDVCAAWNLDGLELPTGASLAPDVPALVVTGRFDPVTSPRFGQRIADRLADSVLVEVPDVGHGALEHLGDCGRELAAAFVADPAAAAGGGLDTSCVTDRVYEPALELAPYYRS